MRYVILFWTLFIIYVDSQRAILERWNSQLFSMGGFQNFYFELRATACHLEKLRYG